MSYIRKTHTALFIASLLAIFSQSALAKVTQVTATVDKNPVMADESFTLTVTANDDVSRNAFDASVLMRDFVVGRTSVSSQTQIVNFNTSKTTKWSTVIVPAKTGRFTIPAFSIDGVSSEPIQMMVVPVSQAAGQPKRDLFITTDVDMQQVYLQQQVRYTVKLHIAQDLQRGSLAAPTLEDADIRQLGEDKEYSDIIDGKRYRIIERNFAIIPQKSGQFTINAPLFEGEVLNNSRQSFGFFNRTQTIRRVGPSVELEVMPIPQNALGHWLPSAFVDLREEWQPDNGEYKVGEPITRTLTLTAVGLVEEQLPEIGARYPNQVKNYPEQANTATVDRDGNLIAQRVETVAIIPSQAGEITLPAIEVPWFNVKTQTMQLAKLPERNITIAPAPNDNSAQSAPLPSLVQNAAGQNAALTNNDEVVAEKTRKANPLWIYLTGIFALLWLLTLASLVNVKRRLKNAPFQADGTGSAFAATAPITNVSLNQLNKLIKQQGKSNPSQIDPPLLGYLNQACGTQGKSLSQCLAKLNDPALEQAINGFYASRYAADSASTHDDSQIDALIDALKKLNTQSSEKTSGVALRSLYPA